MSVRNIATVYCDSVNDLADVSPDALAFVPASGSALGLYRYVSGAWTQISLPGSRDVRMGTVLVDFGLSPFGDTALVSVAATFVTSGTRINCQPLMIATDDHDIEDVLIEQIIVRPTNVVPGVGFDIAAYAPNGTWGKYSIIWSGR